MNNIRDFSWSVVLCWVVLAVIGMLAIFSATQGPVAEFLSEFTRPIFRNQVIFRALGLILLIGLQWISPRSFIQGSYLLYGIGILLMIFTLFFGTEINGAKSWLRIGPFSFQSSEIMKIATILATANYLTSRRDISAENIRAALTAVVLILLPATLVLLQNDLGTTLVFLALIPVMLFWSGLPYGVSLFMISPAIIVYLTVFNWWWGLIAVFVLSALIFFIQKRVWLIVTSFVTGLMTLAGVQLALFQILKPHQIARIFAFTNPNYDPTGAGWNVIQAKIAIGSGGMTGKGFMQGTQTQLKFLPEQWTDFVFCVIGEESGFLGAGLVIITFIFLFIRLLNMAGAHKHPFAQLVTVSITAVFFVHFFVNIGSATGLLPVIGIPLPFVSSGGSAFLANTLMLGICLNMDFYKRDFSIYR